MIMTRLPDVIVIGAMKCGTTSLFEYLKRHPELSSSKRKEPNFFTTHWDKGIRWYEKQFKKDNRLKFETSPGYTRYPMLSDVPRRIHEVLPNVKLIYIVRNPIERIVSQIHHNLLVGRLDDSEYREEDFWSKTGRKYIYTSMYHLQLKQYLEYFSMDNILVVHSEELNNSTVETMRTIARFIGINEKYYNKDLEFRHLNVSKLRLRPRLMKMSRILWFLFNRRLLFITERIFMEEIKRPVLGKVQIGKLANELVKDLVEFENVIGRAGYYSDHLKEHLKD